MLSDHLRKWGVYYLIAALGILAQATMPFWHSQSSGF